MYLGVQFNLAKGELVLELRPKEMGKQKISTHPFS
jgi:hypothetical protein